MFQFKYILIMFFTLLNVACFSYSKDIKKNKIHLKERIECRKIELFLKKKKKFVFDIKVEDPVYLKNKKEQHIVISLINEKYKLGKLFFFQRYRRGYKILLEENIIAPGAKSFGPIKIDNDSQQELVVIYSECDAYKYNGIDIYKYFKSKYKKVLSLRSKTYYKDKTVVIDIIGKKVKIVKVSYFPPKKYLPLKDKDAFRIIHYVWDNNLLRMKKVIVK